MATSDELRSRETPVTSTLDIYSTICILEVCEGNDRLLGKIFISIKTNIFIWHAFGAKVKSSDATLIENFLLK